MSATALAEASEQGIIHDFVMVNAMRDTHAAPAATAQGGEFLHAALHDQ
jgi:acetyl esterase